MDTVFLVAHWMLRGAVALVLLAVCAHFTLLGADIVATWWKK